MLNFGPKAPVLLNIRGKIEISSPDNLLCRKIATFLIHDAAVVEI